MHGYYIQLGHRDALAVAEHGQHAQFNEANIWHNYAMRDQQPDRRLHY